jgi:caffeoyl-CoA O-methyltransferase
MLDTSPMSKLFGQNEPKIVDYAEQTFKPQDSILTEIRERSKKNKLPDIHVGSMDGLHLEVLTRACGVKKAVEIGTLGGYSGVCIARGLQPGGILHTFEVNAENAAVAKESFQKASVSERVEIHVGPALENLAKIENQGPFDLVFIDADKVSYPKYLAWAAQNLRVGGVVLGDNTFAWGIIADTKFDSEQTEKSVLALREFNEVAASSGVFKATILPTGEGLTLAVKVR